MSVFAVKERVQVSQMSRHLLGIDGFFDMFFLQSHDAKYQGFFATCYKTT